MQALARNPQQRLDLEAVCVIMRGALSTGRFKQRMCGLPQCPELAGTHSLWEEQLKAFNDLRAMEARLAELERGMADAEQYDAALAADVWSYPSSI